MENRDQVEGKVKEKTGELTDDERMEAEGKAHSALGDVKEKAKDAKDEVKERM
jgi:uncharacterized protein YjbJ (UPF0337 family)